MAGERMVLVVEDDPSVQRVTQRALESFGYEAIVVDDTDAAVEATRNSGPELCCVLLDYSLKNGNSVDALSGIHALDRTLPVIIISGYPREQIEGSMGPLDDAAFLQKPYTLDSLRDAIEAIRRR